MVAEVDEGYEIKDQALLPQAVAMAPAQQHEANGTDTWKMSQRLPESRSNRQ